LLDLGDYERAAALFQEALALRRGIGDQAGVATSLHNLGRVARHRGDLRQAGASFRESLDLRRALGDLQGTASSLAELGAVALEERELSRALGLYREALVLYQRVGDRQGVADCLEGVAAAVTRTGAAGEQVQVRLTHAASLLTVAAALRTAIGTQPSPLEQAAHEQRIAVLRAALGEEAFNAAWEAGRTQSLDEAITAALLLEQEEGEPVASGGLRSHVRDVP
jgi:tetratricopeptide (TPR) repeat protein